ncbi:MAG: hypothetical protein JRH16_19995 [Deltaproteobacteria bacterium]|nr:hypothetical protein [Deltaproteobacteria bacterium]
MAGPSHTSHLSRRRHTIFATVTVVAALLALEGFARLAALVSPAVADLRERRQDYKMADPELGKRGSPEFADHDEAGWRNPSRPERAPIVAIGDSQTWGSEVARDDTWPQIAERALGFPVYNISLGGYGVYQYARLIDDALDLQPALILVALYDGNDFYDTFDDIVRDRRMPELSSPDAALLARLEVVEAAGPLEADWKATRRLRKKHNRVVYLNLLNKIDRHVAVYGVSRGRAPTSRSTPRSRAEASRG